MTNFGRVAPFRAAEGDVDNRTEELKLAAQTPVHQATDRRRKWPQVAICRWRCRATATILTGHGASERRTRFGKDGLDVIFSIAEDPPVHQSDPDRAFAASLLRLPSSPSVIAALAQICWAARSWKSGEGGSKPILSKMYLAPQHPKLSTRNSWTKSAKLRASEASNDLGKASVNLEANGRSVCSTFSRQASFASARIPSDWGSISVNFLMTSSDMASSKVGSFTPSEE
eukprot:CAMPEP_0115185912 /NCGR_PEP_ID=MMETSP0270-20121206/9714_1 /TAXON_ID=71861 /ORGANISM="Scrippsiella trochoidea, Strain CCMP3099" /LENGTH=228 /DNA_ID=CAMNT_0002599027 /DNA_START=176 /DNA_END=863 /DNA_ORIENTATION=+